MSAFTKWIEEISGGNMSNRELAKKVGMTVATFHRKWTEDAFVSDDAITIAPSLRPFANRSSRNPWLTDRGRGQQSRKGLLAIRVHDLGAQPGTLAENSSKRRSP